VLIDPARIALQAVLGKHFAFATAKLRSTVTGMMSPEWLDASSRYNRWMNDKLYGLAATLSDEARKRDGGAFFKSMHGTFNHLLLADRVWLARFKGVPVPSGFMAPGGIRSLDQELYVDFEELRRERALTDDELTGWVSGLTQELLAAPLVYMRRGQRLESPLWWAVAHVFNHQTHHRGQITTLLTQQGCDPGVTDLFAMLREQGAQASVG
jgi:uncharacterized damage-inducible protein DinB